MLLILLKKCCRSKFETFFQAAFKSYVIQLCSYVVFYLLNLIENYTAEIDVVLDESFNSSCDVLRRFCADL